MFVGEECAFEVVSSIPLSKVVYILRGSKAKFFYLIVKSKLAQRGQKPRTSSNLSWVSEIEMAAR